VDNPALYAKYPLDNASTFSIFVMNCFGTYIMARPLTFTKERILSAALNLVRSGGPSALTARRLCEALGCGANAILKGLRQEEAQNAPTPITTYAFFRDGEYVTNEQMNDKRFLKVIGK
jgi:hypothetical protein